MKRRHRWIALTIAVAGLATCVFVSVRFFETIWTNDLQWTHRPFFQEHYLVVGRAYSQAFAVGFFSCFFLITAALAIGAWVEPRRRRAPASLVDSDLE